jgi:hypothetical protein
MRRAIINLHVTAKVFERLVEEGCQLADDTMAFDRNLCPQKGQGQVNSMGT